MASGHNMRLVSVQGKKSRRPFTLPCQRCGEDFETTSHRPYCPPCYKAKREEHRAWGSA